jgi:micrococcal nuclease
MATLDTCTKDNTKRFTLAGVRTLGKVVSVYDGDTFTVAFDTLGIGFFLHQVRILGIDAPEIRGKTIEEKAAAAAARDYLRGLIDGRIIDLEIMDEDKYGRLLGRAARHSDGLDISSAMLNSKLVVTYDGGTRKPFIANDPISSDQ